MGCPIGSRGTGGDIHRSRLIHSTGKDGMLIQGSAFHVPLRDQSVHCVVTSPPYWGLRKYAGEQGEEPLGLEPTPDRHIERTVEWAREVYRVLRDDGVFWLNYGDCYAGGGSTTEYGNNFANFSRSSTMQGGHPGGSNRPVKPRVGLTTGNLMMMPHRIALALQADGWVVRQDLVWAKPNPMPESVRGRSFNPAGELRRGSWRHTRAHEYVFMLVKGMGYWSDQEAVREAAIHEGRVVSYAGTEKNAGHQNKTYPGSGGPVDIVVHGRNPRSVLNIPTSPYKGAHYATFPPALIAPLIQATCPRWCCPMCGQGWAPMVEHSNMVIDRSGRADKSGNRTDASGNMDEPAHNRVMGYRPTCDHPHTQAEAVSGTVFDPFVGSGTTVMVARQLLRTGVGLDISRPYLREQAVLRIGDVPVQDHEDLPMFSGNGV